MVSFACAGEKKRGQSSSDIYTSSQTSRCCQDPLWLRRELQLLLVQHQLLVHEERRQRQYGLVAWPRTTNQTQPKDSQALATALPPRDPRRRLQGPTHNPPPIHNKLHLLAHQPRGRQNRRKNRARPRHRPPIPNKKLRSRCRSFPILLRASHPRWSMRPPGRQTDRRSLPSRMRVLPPPLEVVVGGENCLLRPTFPPLSAVVRNGPIGCLVVWQPYWSAAPST